jgi:hypothetical protein
MVPSDIGHANDNAIKPIRNGIDYGDLGIPRQPNPGTLLQPFDFSPARDIPITLPSFSPAPQRKFPLLSSVFVKEASSSGTAVLLTI